MKHKENMKIERTTVSRVTGKRAKTNDDDQKTSRSRTKVRERTVSKGDGKRVVSRSRQVTKETDAD